jgi:hypothetical protein
MERALSINYLRRAAESGALYEILKRNFPGEGNFDELDKPEVREVLKDTDAVNRMLDRLNTDYDRLTHEMALPAEESMSKLDVFNQELAQRVKRVHENPKDNSVDILVSLVFPAAPQAKKTELAIVIRQAMLQAALAYAGGGSAAAAKVVDPVFGTEFQIRPVENQEGWIELTSLLEGRNGKPVSMKARVR